MILFLVASPTPHHTPVLNELHRQLPGEILVYYLCGSDTERGWGRVSVEHPYRTLDGAGDWGALVRALLSPELRVVCVYGYRGLARTTAALLARLRRRPLVLRGEASVRDELRRPPMRRRLKRWYLRALLGQPEVWTNGSANTAYWELLGLRRRQLIPYSLPALPDGESAAPALRADLGLSGRFVYAFVGRLDPVKGIADLLRAYDLVRAVAPAGATALVIAGKGPLEPEVRRYAERHDDCHYLGAVPQERLGAVYRAADVFVAPSLYEPWGWVVNEAIGFGTRVIASDAIAAADDLCVAQTGRRCRVADPADLAAAMRAEFEAGPRRAPRLAPANTAPAMAVRLRQLAGIATPATTVFPDKRPVG